MSLKEEGSLKTERILLIVNYHTKRIQYEKEQKQKSLWSPRNNNIKTCDWKRIVGQLMKFKYLNSNLSYKKWCLRRSKEKMPKPGGTT